MHETKPLRSFGLTVGGIFAVIGFWPAMWRGQSPRLWGLGLGSILITLALLRPQNLARVYRLWMTVGEALGWVNTRIILSVLFYALFTPMGLFMRLRGQDSMWRQFAPEAESYRVVRQPRAASHMQHQF